MGFEMVYRNAQGEEETTIVQVSDLDDLRSELDGFEHHCEGCPANRLKRSFGCIGAVNYPISGRAEVWMLEQLPTPDEPVPFLLLQQGRDMGNTGAQAEGLRGGHPGVFFESPTIIKRQYEEMDVTGEQLFELLFLLGDIQPKRGIMIMLFMEAIHRDMQADELMALTPAQQNYAAKYPFLLDGRGDDDASIRDLKGFFHALYIAWLLDKNVILDV